MVVTLLRRLTFFTAPDFIAAERSVLIGLMHSANRSFELFPAATRWNIPQDTSHPEKVGMCVSAGIDT